MLDGLRRDLHGLRRDSDTHTFACTGRRINFYQCRQRRKPAPRPSLRCFPYVIYAHCRRYTPAATVSTSTCSHHLHAKPSPGACFLLCTFSARFCECFILPARNMRLSHRVPTYAAPLTDRMKHGGSKFHAFELYSYPVATFTAAGAP